MTKIDVLAVMDDVNNNILRPNGGSYSETLEDARAAVAELIEAAKFLVAESVHPYDGGEYEDGEWKALDRARAAVARIGGPV